MTFSPPQGSSLRCQRCGGGFAFAGHGTARCPYCGHVQAPSPALVAELANYRENVQGELAQADQAYGRAAAWEGWADYGKRSTPQLKILIPVVSGVTLFGALAFPASQALGVSPAVVSVLVTPILVAAPFVLMVVVLIQAARTGTNTRRAVAGNVAVACPNCGAPGRIVAGAPTQVCGYCRETLVASAPIMQHGVDAAALAHRHARLEEFRQERAGMASIAAYDMSAYVPYFVLVPLLLMTGGGALGFSVQMLQGAEPYSPAIFVLWGLFLVMLFGGAGFLLLRRNRLAALRGAADDLARQFSGRRLEGLRDAVDWLDRYWPERYPGTKSYPGIYFTAAALDVFGYPTLLVCDTSSGNGRMPKLHLLLAAVRSPSVPSPAPSPAVRAALARVRELGFTVTFTDAGLFGEANAATREHLVKTPAALHAAAPAVTAMARAAHALGAEPAR